MILKSSLKYSFSGYEPWGGLNSVKNRRHSYLGNLMSARVYVMRLGIIEKFERNECYIIYPDLLSRF